MNNSVKIIINGLSAKTGGGVRYLSNLLRFVPSNYHITLILNRESKNLFSNVDSRIEIITFKVPNIIFRVLIEQFWIPSYAYNNNYNLLYSPADMASIFSKTKQIMGVQNPNPYYNLNVKYNFSSVIKKNIQKIIAKVSSKVVEGMIFVSHSIKIEFQKNIKYDGKKIVVYHGLDPNTKNKIISEKTLNSDFILCVSDFYPHKNFEVLIKAYNCLPQHIQKSNKLLIVGGFINLNYYNKIKRMINSYKLGDSLIAFFDISSYTRSSSYDFTISSDSLT